MPQKIPPQSATAAARTSAGAAPPVVQKTVQPKAAGQSKTKRVGDEETSITAIRTAEIVVPIRLEFSVSSEGEARVRVRPEEQAEQQPAGTESEQQPATLSAHQTSGTQQTQSTQPPATTTILSRFGWAGWLVLAAALLTIAAVVYCTWASKNTASAQSVQTAPVVQTPPTQQPPQIQIPPQAFKLNVSGTVDHKHAHEGTVQLKVAQLVRVKQEFW